jgi:hypothetical protein
MVRGGDAFAFGRDCPVRNEGGGGWVILERMRRFKTVNVRLCGPIGGGVLTSFCAGEDANKQRRVGVAKLD